MTIVNDVVFLTVSETIPIAATAQPYANRLELRFGRAYPVTLTVERGALDRLAELINEGRRDLDAASTNPARENPHPGTN